MRAKPQVRPRARCRSLFDLATDPYLWPAQATKAALRQAGLCYVARKTFVGQTPTPKYKADLSPPIGRLLVTLQGDKSDSQTYELCLFVAVHMSLSGTSATYQGRG
jgi:hypothetical protein